MSGVIIKNRRCFTWEVHIQNWLQIAPLSQKTK